MADPCLRFTAVRFFGDMRTTVTEYICGSNTRSESRSCSGHSDNGLPGKLRYEYGPLRAYIQNREIGYRFELEPASRIYAAFRIQEYGRRFERRTPQGRSGKVLDTHTETIPTAEMKEMYGYTARHVITNSRQLRDSQVLSESECDGWYIDPPAAWLNLHPPQTLATFLSCGEGENDDHRFTEIGKRETGFVVQSRQSHKSYSCDETGSLRLHERIRHEEVVEFSEAQLPPDLFVPPGDFRRVPDLPGPNRYRLAYRTRRRWEMLKDAFSLPNKVAGFTAQKLR